MIDSQVILRAKCIDPDHHALVTRSRLGTVGAENAVPPSPMARLQLQLMGAVAEFGRSLIRERQREGIAIARAAGNGRLSDISSHRSRLFSSLQS